MSPALVRAMQTGELAVTARMHEANGDTEAAASARWQAVELNEGLARTLARQHVPSTPVGEDDLLSLARIGLFRALRRFDPGRGFRFSTYARWWVLLTIHRHGRQADPLSDRPQGRPRPVVGTGAAEEVDQLAAPTVDADRALDLLAVAVALGKLPPQQRRVLELVYWSDLPLVSVAGLLGVSRGRAYTLHSDALRALRGRLRQVADV